MNKLNLLYNAFRAYRNITSTNNILAKERKNINKITNQDLFNIIKYNCVIEQEWIDKIDWGLVYIDKAIREERQFIRTNSEVVPIEKVRRIGKETVAHLARHSDLITKEPENEEEIIPDELLMVEKLSDYAVYENRFLYMLLCYLRDFILIRVEKIRKYLQTYESNLVLNKKIDTKYRNLNLEIKLNDCYYDNPYNLLDTKNKALLQRLDNFLIIISAYLETPLMHDVAKTPMIKPPIVKTNVLKMNNNFKNALSLYEYIVNFNKDGFEITEVNNDLIPLNDITQDEFSDTLNLLCFLSYKIGNNLEETLNINYLEEQKKLDEEATLRLKERIKRLKKDLQEDNKSIDEYILALEEQINNLEKQASLLNEKDEKLNLLNIELQTIKAEYQNLVNIKDQLEEKLEEQENNHKLEIVTLETEYKTKASTIKENQDYIIDSLNEKIEEQINSYASLVKEATLNLEAQRRTDLANYDESILKLKEASLENEAKKNDEITSLREKISLLEHENELLNSELTLKKATLHSINLKNGLGINEDYSEEERFKELEQEFDALAKFFKDNWNKAKKQIRKTILWKDKLS